MLGDKQFSGGLISTISNRAIGSPANNTTNLKPNSNLAAENKTNYLIEISTRRFERCITPSLVLIALEFSPADDVFIL